MAGGCYFAGLNSVTEMSASRQILMIYIKTVASVAPC